MFAHKDHTDGCLIWPFGSTNRGAPTIQIQGRKFSARQVMCTLAHGSAPSEKHQAHLTCQTPFCVSPACLGWLTKSEIRAKCPATGAHKRLPAPAIQDILTSSDSYDVLAARHGIHYSYVSTLRKKARAQA